MTSADVARLAGVSRATVSYILNDTPNQTISEATRSRVLKAAADLNYTPLASARILRRGRSDIVLLLLPNWPIGPNLAKVMDALGRALEAHNLTMVTRSHLDDRSLMGLWRAITPAAVIRVGSLGADLDAELRRAAIGVLVEVDDHESASAAVTIPDSRGGRMQVEHLAATGHRRLGYALPDDSRLREFWEPRLHGSELACVDLGLDLPLVAEVSFDMDVTRAALAKWREAGVTGVCAYNDEMAMCILAAARAEGYRLPADLAVIGFDDIPTAPLVDPPLTTLRLDAERFAAVVTSHILYGLNGDAERLRVDSGTVELVIRESA
ncbi:MAG: LacI family DNA-binding transcriptional regulator [Propionicimonas sp.]